MDIPGDRPRMLAGEELVARGIVKFRLFRPETGVHNVTAVGSPLEQQQVQSSLEARNQLLEVERIEKDASLSHAKWNEKLMLAEVTKMAGGHWQFMGHHIEQQLYVLPEEALFLMETNALLLTDNKVPVSLQQAYPLLLRSEESVAAYKAYATFSRAGYKVFRHKPAINTETNSVNEIKKEEDEPIQTELKADSGGNTANIGVIKYMKSDTCSDNEKKDDCASAKGPVSLEVGPSTGCDEFHLSNDAKDVDMPQVESTCKTPGWDAVIDTATTENVYSHVSYDITDTDMVQVESSCITSGRDAVLDTVTAENMAKAESTCKTSYGNVDKESANTGCKKLHISNENEDIDMVPEECKTFIENSYTENEIMCVAKVDCITKLDLLSASQLKPNDCIEIEKNFQKVRDREHMNQTFTFGAPSCNCIPQNVQQNKTEYKLNEQSIKLENECNNPIIDLDEIDDSYPVAPEEMQEEPNGPNSSRTRAINEAQYESDIEDNSSIQLNSTQFSRPPIINFQSVLDEPEHQVVEDNFFRPQFQTSEDMMSNFAVLEALRKLRQQFFIPEVDNHLIMLWQQQALSRAMPQETLNDYIIQKICNKYMQRLDFNRFMHQRAVTSSMDQQPLNSFMQPQAFNSSIQQHVSNSPPILQYGFYSPMEQQASDIPMQQRASNSAMQFNRPLLIPNPTHQNMYSEDANVSSTTYDLPTNLSKSSTSKQRFHIESIANLVAKLRHINKQRNVPLVKRSALDRVIATYNMRYNTNLVLTNDLDLYNGENIIDVIDSDEENVNDERHREDCTDEQFSQDLNEIQHLAAIIRELAAYEHDTSVPSGRISELIKRFNRRYNTNISLVNNIIVFHNLITIDSSSESESDEPTNPMKTLKNPYNILKQLSDNVSNSYANSRNHSASASTAQTATNTAATSSDSEISITNTATKTELNFPIDQTTDEYISEFHKNHPCEYANWLEMKICILELIKASEKQDGPSIINNLTIIKSCTDVRTENSLRINFDVYDGDVKNFQKTCPPKPHFRITCISESSYLPSGSDVAALNASYNDGVVNIFAVVGTSSLSVLQIKLSQN